MKTELIKKWSENISNLVTLKAQKFIDSNHQINHKQEKLKEFDAIANF